MRPDRTRFRGGSRPVTLTGDPITHGRLGKINAWNYDLLNHGLWFVWDTFGKSAAPVTGFHNFLSFGAVIPIADIACIFSFFHCGGFR
jgi:hypothetical protein